MYFVADTHAFLWYLIDSPKLSKKARRYFELADKGEAVIIVPAIVLLECLDVTEKKKVAVTFDEIVVKMTQASNFILAEINWSLILEVWKVKGLKDLHDRVIIAAARIFDAGLISKDKIIRKHYPKTIW